MTVRRVVVLVVAIGILGISIWVSVWFAKEMSRDGHSFISDPFSLFHVATGLFYAGVLVLLEGILAAVRKEG